MSAQTASPRIADPAAFGRVAVLMGGTSAEREVSLDSGRNVLEALRARGVDAFAVDGIPALIDAIRAGKVDRVFNILHGNKGGGEDGVLQGLCEALGVPYTGSGVLGSALSMDKIRTKQVWLSVGLPTPRYVRLAKGDDVHAAARSLGLPVFVKPSCEGSSVGVSRVLDEADLDAAVAQAARYPGELLMEQLIVGDELTVPVLGREALPSIRIVPKGEWYDYHAKYVSDDTRYLCPGLEGAEEAEIRRLALAAFDAAGCSGWGRVDFMRERATGQLYLLEINTAPGMTSHSLVPKAARQVGIDFAELCWRVLESSLKPDGGAAA
ncbi:D-alanine--D-alanine ligase [Vulcaniibacterium tengchongense]|uniref:D-alanine--D-alanine ligase n=1 Tax=Vulcaniibacterium tengchongense TaxID=1273429 RepID=A0A3N4V973_9GAMM|nr:D-alanine--D-alanine ligase [Vulcaniibacterium tengchongense]RPE79522.1 D-alanine--D-alanine ligase [Vulcaniibacterium tengchongense]